MTVKRVGQRCHGKMRDTEQKKKSGAAALQVSVTLKWKEGKKREREKRKFVLMTDEHRTSLTHVLHGLSDRSQTVLINKVKKKKQQTTKKKINIKTVEEAKRKYR